MTILRLLIALLLGLQTGALCPLPASAHRSLCIGADGHFDISTSQCATAPGVQKKQNLPPEEADHHNDCLDVAIGCLSPDGARPATGSTCSLSDPGSRPASPFLAAACLSPPRHGFRPLAITSFSPVGQRRDRLPFPLVVLRTIVLLI